VKTSKDKILRKSVALYAFWAFLSLMAIGGITYAWFTFSTHTNVTPMAGAIGSGGAELQISNSPSGPFGDTTELIVEGSIDNLQPVSTEDLSQWFASTGNNAAGISDRFVDVSSKVDDMTMFGKLYLKSTGGACEVFFDKENVKFGQDDQLIASSRLGVVIKTQEDGEKRYIFKLDSLCNPGSAEATETMNDSNVVVIDENGGTTQDPSKDIFEYGSILNGSGIQQGSQVLCHIREDEVVEIEYRLYMEGCDENTINVSQDRDIEIQLGFVGNGVR